MIMNREEWISYYESINGHKPSVLEIAKAEKDEKDKPTTAITIDSIEVVKDYNFKS